MLTTLRQTVLTLLLVLKRYWHCQVQNNAENIFICKIDKQKLANSPNLTQEQRGVVLQSKCAPRYGQPGGGVQIYIPDPDALAPVKQLNRTGGDVICEP